MDAGFGVRESEIVLLLRRLGLDTGFGVRESEIVLLLRRLGPDTGFGVHESERVLLLTFPARIFVSLERRFATDLGCYRAL